MSPVTPFPDRDVAREQASEWIARAFRGLTSEEQARLREWSRKPVNRQAMEEMSSVWRGLDVLSVLADLFPREEARRAAQPEAQARPPRARLPLRRWALATAATVALAALAILWTHYLGPLALPLPAPSAQVAMQAANVYSSAVGEHRSLRLPDGSTLSLNSDTVVEVALSPGMRALTLHRGEAHFAVAHDPARPFVVTVGSTTVRAVGTAFNIRRRTGRAMDVLVTQGVVSTFAGSEARLEAGQLLRLSEDGTGTVTRLDTAAIDALTAWQRGLLVLDGTTLADAMEEMARYTTRRIVIDDPAIATLRLGGSLPIGDLEAMLRALEASFGIGVAHAADGSVHLGAAAPDD